MKFIERYFDLIGCDNLEDWRNRILQLGREFGYEHTLLAIFPDNRTPIEAEFAFLHSNYPPHWLSKYHDEKMGHIDPTVSHCINKSTPLIWSPEIFSSQKQKEMYEEACGYGVKSGVTLPIHGTKGELGILCFVSDTNPNKRFHRDANHHLPELSCLRDFIFESSLQFMKGQTEKPIYITDRELECLKWYATGKSSWAIGQILQCSDTTINFHFSNIRRKFNTATRQQAIIKAISLGLIQPN